jgi:hypothetical protein
MLVPLQFKKGERRQQQNYQQSNLLGSAVLQSHCGCSHPKANVHCQPCNALLQESLHMAVACMQSWLHMRCWLPTPECQAFAAETVHPTPAHIHLALPLVLHAAVQNHTVWFAAARSVLVARVPAAHLLAMM